MLTNYGVQGTHYTIKDGVPTFTPTGHPGGPALHLPVPRVAAAHHRASRTSRSWRRTTQAGWPGQAPNIKKPLFFGMQIVEPQRYATLYTHFDDLQKDIRRGRKKVSDVDAGGHDWKNSGGDKLRDWYQEILDKNGSGN